jgi:hypothetical protein
MSTTDKTSWKPLTTASDTVAAGIVAGRLRAEGVSVDVRTDTALLGEARLCRLYVPAEQLRRAAGIISQSGFSDAELDALALSQAPPKD